MRRGLQKCEILLTRGKKAARAIGTQVPGPFVMSTSARILSFDIIGSRVIFQRHIKSD